MQLGLNGALLGWRPLSGNSAWNTRIDYAAVDPSSNNIINLIGPRKVLIDCEVPYYVVDKNQKRVPVTITGADSVPFVSDVEKAPIPNGTLWYQSNSDSHGVVIDKDRMMEYDFWYPSQVNGQWQAKVACQWNLLAGDLQRPWFYVSANGSGVPIFPYLLKLEEALSGVINHALGFTLRGDVIAGWFTPPALCMIFNSLEPFAVGCGTRLRLKRSFNETGYGPIALAIIHALKNYGMILVDAGADLFITATADAGWKNYATQLQSLRNLTTNDFEVLNIGPRYNFQNKPSS